MRLSLHPTTEVIGINGDPHRIWRGEDEFGTPVIAAIAFVQPQTADADKLRNFEENLLEIPKPAAAAAGPFDLRQVICGRRRAFRSPAGDLMKSPCGHDHTGHPLQAVACEARNLIKDVTGGDVAIAVILADDVDPAISLLANHAALARMVMQLAAYSLKEPRPTDCDVCAFAWDRLNQVNALMRAGSYNC